MVYVVKYLPGLGEDFRKSTVERFSMTEEVWAESEKQSEREQEKQNLSKSATFQDIF